MSRITQHLNKRQAEAVTYPPGPLLIFAGAGTGKTRVLTHRIAYLVGERGVSPASVLAVTFTNKAADEMRERISALIGARLSGMWVGTFHAMCSRILRIDGTAIGVPRDFTIYDAGDQETLMKRVAEGLLLDGKDPSFKPRALLAEVSRAKNELLSPREYERTAADERERRLAQAYASYQQALDRAHALDFDDLIARTVELFREKPSVLAAYQRRFRHVLVDEYQDINYAQYAFVTLLAKSHGSLTVVGDDDQSIYRWRGADVRLILQFERDFPSAHVVKLEQNYRSTQSILDGAYHVIRHNRRRADKRLFSDAGHGEPIVVYRALSEREEAAWVAAMVGSDLAQGASCAVLARTNAQSRALEEAFTDAGIPYQLVGGLRFYDRKEIKDVVAYLKVLANPFDTVSLLRIINTPARGIGAVAVERLSSLASERAEPVLAVALAAESHSKVLGRSSAAIARFGEVMGELIALAPAVPAAELIRAVLVRSGYERALAEEHTADADTRLENVRELITAAERFAERSGESSLESFLEHVALVSDVDAMSDAGGVVSLMTLHAAKGLEFDTVFIVGMEESVFPHYRSLDDELALEEERRLCYVGMTRAKRRLCLTYATCRALFGATRSNLPSRFLTDIPPELVVEHGQHIPLRRSMDAELEAIRSRSAGQGQLDLASTLSRRGRASGTATTSQPGTPVGPAQSGQCRHKPGERVKHPRFGVGVVVSVNGGDTVTVAFEGHGVKRLALAYARLDSE